MAWYSITRLLSHRRFSAETVQEAPKIPIVGNYSKSGCENLEEQKTSMASFSGPHQKSKTAPRTDGLKITSENRKYFTPLSSSLNILFEDFYVGFYVIGSIYESPRAMFLHYLHHRIAKPSTICLTLLVFSPFEIHSKICPTLCNSQLWSRSFETHCTSFTDVNIWKNIQ